MMDKEQALNLYAAELIKWNSKMNLIGRKTEHEIRHRHIEDSLTLVPFIQSRPESQIIDIGTGAGLPGIPLSLSFPGKHLYLAEVQKKKIAFLEYIIGLLNLNAEVYHPLERNALKGSSLIVSRAYGTVSKIIEWRNLHSQGSDHFILLKGRKTHAEEELNEAGILQRKITEKSGGVITEFDLGCVTEG